MDPRIDRPETGCPATPKEHQSRSTSRGNAYDRLFDTGIAHLHRYAAEHGSSSPLRDATIDGFAIGQWVVNRRAEYRRGHLSAERIVASKPSSRTGGGRYGPPPRRAGGDLVPSEHDSPTAGRRRADNRRFDAGIAHLHRYVAAHGSSSPARHATIGDFRIGAWVDSRRTDYRLGRLSSERIHRLHRRRRPRRALRSRGGTTARGLVHHRRRLPSRPVGPGQKQRLRDN
ncbi:MULTISPECIES: helicase associated domain-containing protein [Gordonia]|uniref:helicase associated domain-containing protein n=1 Tax=Gordonia TaxID=2053 RepID=UPI001E2C0D1A|nr:MULTISPECIES: helicase associated domain-containing protein [Gordonia]